MSEQREAEPNGPLTGEILQELAQVVGAFLARFSPTGIPPAFSIQAWRDGDIRAGVNHVSNAERDEAFAALEYLLVNQQGTGR